ncbi:HAD family hydrolase [Novosphingobium sp. BW1]|uniref:HAD family hydrolase n=1 Tax=Novosphingobium sp. BW1 TaxID=2592621 RepID=UPI0011DE6B51|nr:HAD family hydrolase [Novosphingobium sp. BW1]TYC89164.1 haloacid dehalogenase-like hydrolase [Novosphingobium sp. BW1]
MKVRILSGLLGAVAALTATASAANEPLAHWPAGARASIKRALADAPEGSFAVFDADNTIWQNDLEESLLPFMEARGKLSPKALDPSLKPIPFHKGETLYGYYLRLCEIDDNLCYPWIAQVFSGHTLGELKGEVDALMARTAPIPVRYEEDGKVVSGTVERPHIFEAQRELLDELRARGVHVYVVTAASEELARMVLSDPRYGLNIAPEDIVGVTMVLRDPRSGALTTARSQIAKGHFLDAHYPAERHMGMEMTSTLWAPNTWYEGKVAGIRTYIDAVNRPLLVAGDSPSDRAMLFQASGLRLWIDRSAAKTAALEEAKAARARAQRESGQRVDADTNWLHLRQEELAPRP